MKRDRRWLMMALAAVAAMLAADYYTGTAESVEALVIGRRLSDARENSTGSYGLRLRLPDGAWAEIDVPEDTDYREGATALLTRVRGGLFGADSYRFEGYR